MAEQRGSDGSYWDLEQAAWVRYPGVDQPQVPAQQGGGSAEWPHEAAAASDVAVAAVAVPPTE